MTTSELEVSTWVYSLSTTDTNAVVIPGRLYPLDIVVVTLFFALMVVTVGGNSLTIVAIRRCPWLHNPGATAVEGVAWTDAFMGVSGFIRVVDVIILPRFVGVIPWVATSMSYVTAFLTVSASTHITFLAAERYVAVTYPYLHTKYVTTEYVRVTDACIWLMSSVISLIHLFLYLTIHQDLQLWLSKAQLETGTQVVNIFLYLILATTNCALYLKVATIAHKQRRQIADLERSVNRGEVQSDDDNGSQRAHGEARISKATRMILVTLSLHLLLWLPTIIVEMIAVVIGTYTETMSYVALIGLFLGHVNSAANVGVYGLMNSRYRVAYKIMLRHGTVEEISRDGITAP